jgi:hypothetical protein
MGGLLLWHLKHLLNLFAFDFSLSQMKIVGLICLSFQTCLTITTEKTLNFSLCSTWSL